MTFATVILAHQGGWDEMLLVAGPIIVVVALLRMAERRARRNRAHNDAPPTDAPATDTPANEIS